MQGHPIIDADGHVLEKDAELHDFLEGRYRDLPRSETYPASFFPWLDGWPRGLVNTRGKDRDVSAARWIEFLDELGIAASVLYPTGGLALGLIQNPEWACALARAYNTWVHERYAKVSDRLKPVALLPIHDPVEAARELRRAREELGLVAALLPAVTILHKGYGHRDFDPIYAEAERLGMPLTVHGAPSHGMGIDHFDKFVEIHALEHPIAILTQFTHMVFEGVFDRFPGLRVAFLEAGAGWLPYMMDRLDEEFEKPYGAAASLKRTPGEIIRSGQIWVTCEVEERTLPQVLRQCNPRCVMWPSDYPHERLREQFGGDIPEFVGREDLGAEEKRWILYENPKRFYGLAI